MAVLEICSEKNTRESVVGTFKNICTVAVHCWYIKDAFVGFCQQIYLTKFQKAFGGKLTKNFYHAHQILAIKGVGFWVHPLKKENLWQKSFSDNVEWSSKKL